jgi:tetratricopeptide (TPR) repeat protein
MPTLLDSYLRHAQHYLVILLNADHLYKQGGTALQEGLALFDREWANIQVGQSRVERLIRENRNAAYFCLDYTNAGANILPLRLTSSERIKWLEAAINAAHQLQDPEAESWHIGNIGRIYESRGEPRRAIELYRQAILINRKFGDRYNEARGLGNIASAYSDLGELKSAITYIEQALSIVREIGDRHEEGGFLGKLGVAYSLLGDEWRALDLYRQQLVIAQEFGDFSGAAEANNNLGLAYLKFWQLGSALEYLMRALKLYEEIGDSHHQIIVLNNIGLVYLNIDEPEHALEIFKQVEELNYSEGNPIVKARALVNQAISHELLGNLDEAIICAEAALEIYQTIENSDLNRVLAMLAEWKKRRT